MTRLLGTLAALVLLALTATVANAYMTIRVPLGSTGQALPVRWDLGNTAARPNVANRRVLYEIGDAGTVDGPNFLGPIDEFQAIQNSFANWRNVNESEIDFEFDGAVASPTSSASDNRNMIYWKGSNIATGVFAVTITTFDTTSGQIVDADMELNDRDFTWDTLGATATSGIIGRAMIESVVTHELGHFVGMDHPNNAQSSMYFASSPGLINQTTLEADDRAALIDAYPHPTISDASLGTVQGTVSDAGGAKFGVYVTLVDMATGRNVVGAASEGTPGPFTLGAFTIENVPPGSYLAFACPVDKPSLGSYYGTAFTSFYPIVRGVAVGTAGAPTLVQVGPGATVTGVSVSLPASPQNPFEPDGSSATAHAITSGQVTVARISPTTDQDWFSFTTTAANQQVTIRVLSDTFGFDLNPTLTMYAGNGSTVLVSPDFGDPVFMSSANDNDDSAFDVSGVNYDATIVRTMPTAGNFFFKVASRVGVTSGDYVVTFEVSGANTTPDVVTSTVEASVAGVPSGSGNSFTVTITPRNMFARDINAPSTFDVDLMNVTGAPTVLQSITNASTPFTFTVTAAASSQVVKYGARIDGVLMTDSASVSHYGTLSTSNSRIVLLESTLNANGYDRIPMLVELRDGSNNLTPNGTIPVTLSTTLGSLDNGTTSGASNIPATFDAATGKFKIQLVAPGNTGTATVTAFANSVQIDSKQVEILPRASGTGSSGGGGNTDGGEEDDGGGGCAVGASPAALCLLLFFGVAWGRRRVKTGE